MSLLLDQPGDTISTDELHFFAGNPEGFARRRLFRSC
jgi:hypothetical protein